MKIYIPDTIQSQLLTLPKGTALLGAHSRGHGVASVTEARPPGEAAPPSARQTLAVIGEGSGQFPFVVDDSDRRVWSDFEGNPVEVVAYRSGEFFKRTPFDPAITSHLQEERVLIIGTGSVGAQMAIELAKSGVGTIILVDKDILEIHNCMRHVLGTAYIGWPKPIALKHYIEEHAPTCECIPVFGDIFEGGRTALRQLIEKTRPTKILAATDVLKVQYLCQRASLHYKIPLMAVWCDSNAVEGEIFMWESGQALGWKPGRPERGCYACMRDPDEMTITRSSHFDYSSDDPDSYGGEPALGIFINRVSNIASIVMLAWMVRGCSVRTKVAGILDQHYEGKGLQYIRLGGPYAFEAEGQLTAKAPWAVEWYRVLKREDCPFCSDLDGNEAVLFPRPAEAVSHSDAWDNYEEVQGD